jgi:hypothetical protein
VASTGVIDIVPVADAPDDDSRAENTEVSR